MSVREHLQSPGEKANSILQVLKLIDKIPYVLLYRLCARPGSYRRLCTLRDEVRLGQCSFPSQVPCVVLKVYSPSSQGEGQGFFQERVRSSEESEMFARCFDIRYRLPTCASDIVNMLILVLQIAILG